MTDNMYETFRSLVENTTINSVTLLSTDYLNHFNEAVMLLDMVPDMPDMLDDVKEWQPKSYADHFRDSQFKARDLAVEAFDWSPDEYRKPFDALVEELNGMIADSLPKIEAAIPRGDELAVIVQDVTMVLRASIERAGAIINGSKERTGQYAIDAMFAGEQAKQSEIDALFDSVQTDQTAVDALFDGPGDEPAARDAESSQSLWTRFAPPAQDIEAIAPDVAIAFSRGVAEALGAAAR